MASIQRATGTPIATLAAQAFSSACLDENYTTLDDSPGLMPASDRFMAFLGLIERDNPALYNKLRNLD